MIFCNYLFGAKSFLVIYGFLPGGKTPGKNTRNIRQLFAWRKNAGQKPKNTTKTSGAKTYFVDDFWTIFR